MFVVERGPKKKRLNCESPTIGLDNEFCRQLKIQYSECSITGHPRVPFRTFITKPKEKGSENWTFSQKLDI